MCNIWSQFFLCLHQDFKPVAADSQQRVHVAAGYFLVEGDTVAKDMCHFELVSAVPGQLVLVSKAEEASQATEAVVVVVEEVPLVLMVVAVEEILQVYGSAAEEGTLALMEAVAGETHWASVVVVAVKEPLVLIEVVVEETHQVFGVAVVKHEGTVVSVDQVWQGMSLKAGEEKVTVVDLAVVLENLEIDSQPKQRTELLSYKWSYQEKGSSKFSSEPFQTKQINGT